MSFRQKVESGLGQAEDAPQEREWRDMWKTTDSYWNEFEGMHFKWSGDHYLTFFFRSPLAKGPSTKTLCLEE